MLRNAKVQREGWRVGLDNLPLMPSRHSAPSHGQILVANLDAILHAILQRWGPTQSPENSETSQESLGQNLRVKDSLFRMTNKAEKPEEKKGITQY